MGRKVAVPTIKRYGDRVKLWQIWNEPDAFWNEDPAQARGFATAFATPSNYMDLVKRTHKAGHALGIPGLRIMASLSSGEIPQHTQELFDLGLGDCFDGMIIHTYGNHVRHFQNQIKLLDKLGQPKAALGSGEMGLPRGNDWDGAMRQARIVAQWMFSSATIPKLLCAEWFVLHDTVAGGNFGLTTPENQPHPSAMTYFTAAHLLAGARQAEIDERGGLTFYRVQRDGRPPVTAVTNNGSPILVAFTTRDKQPPVVWDLLGQPVEVEIKEGKFTVEVTEGVFIEGEATAQSTVSPTVTMSMDDTGRPVVRVSVGKGDDLADAKIDLTVDEADLKISQTQGLDRNGDAVFTPGAAARTRSAVRRDARRVGRGQQDGADDPAGAHAGLAGHRETG